MTSPQTIDVKLKSHNIRVYFTEVLAECGKRKTRNERIELLRTFRDKNAETKITVQKIMEWLTHEKVVLALPEGTPPFKSETIGDYNLSPLTLLKALDRASYFVKGYNNFIQSNIKREHFFTQTLESMFKPDAEFYCMLKDRKITGIHGVTVQLLIDAYQPEKATLGNE
jgi:hypothetical protein